MTAFQNSPSNKVKTWWEELYKLVKGMVGKQIIIQYNLSEERDPEDDHGMKQIKAGETVEEAFADKPSPVKEVKDS